MTPILIKDWDRSGTTTYAPEIGMYPNNEPYVKAHNGYVPNVMGLVVRPHTMQDFVTAMFLADAMRERGKRMYDLVLPHVPGSRQDRLNEGDGVDLLFTSKSVAKMINDRSFERVSILDPHSDVTPALIERCKVHHAVDVISTLKSDWTSVVSPDAGAEKRAGMVAKKLGIPLVHGWKTRDLTTGAIKGFGVEQAHYDVMVRPLVVDDLCDGGGTFAGLADFIRKAYGTYVERLDLYVSHGLFTKGLTPLANFDTIYTTDSVANPETAGNLHTIPYVKDHM